jgi:hypothetical protein
MGQPMCAVANPGFIRSMPEESRSSARLSPFYLFSDVAHRPSCRKTLPEYFALDLLLSARCGSTSPPAGEMNILTKTRSAGQP